MEITIQNIIAETLDPLYTFLDDPRYSAVERQRLEFAIKLALHECSTRTIQALRLQEKHGGDKKITAGFNDAVNQQELRIKSFLN